VRRENRKSKRKIEMRTRESVSLKRSGVCMYVCMYEWLYIGMYVCMYVCVYVCLCMCVYVRM
jgi:hypothetical protein